MKIRKTVTILNTVSRMIVRIFVLVISLSEVFIPHTVVASEISIKSGSRKAREQSNVLPADACKSPSESITRELSSCLLLDLLAITGAQPDLRLTSYHQLSKILDKFLFSTQQDPGGFRSRWRSLWRDHLKAPENLLSKKKINKFLVNLHGRLLNENHKIFVFFNSTSKALTQYEADLCSFIDQNNIKTLPLESLHSNFRLMRQQYQTFKDTLIELVNGHIKTTDKTKLRLYRKQIDAHLESKAMWMSDMQPELFHSISQETALQMLAFNEQGNRSQRPTGQNHYVPCLPPKDTNLTSIKYSGRVYFKNEGNPHLQPGREAMVYHLYSLLGIPTAETGLLFIDNVKLHSDEITNDFFKDGRNIRPFCVQVSHEIVGERGDSFLCRSYQELRDIIDYPFLLLANTGSAPNLSR